MKRAQNYFVKLTSIECKDIDKKHVLNVTCNIKAVRGKNGVANIAFLFKNIQSFSVTYQLFYRNSGGHYLPYIVDLTINMCQLEIFSLKHNIIAKILLPQFEKYSSGFFDGCPFNVRIKKIYIDSIIKKNFICTGRSLLT